VPAEGEPVSASASGQLTLRGATNAVTFPVDAQLVGDRIELVGAIDVLFSDYGIDNPSNPLVKVRDEGLVEVQLFFTLG
jgi:polyisoprenoid-binding protein YceI